MFKRVEKPVEKELTGGTPSSKLSPNELEPESAAIERAAA
jgi:hypothetical protein